MKKRRIHLRCSTIWNGCRVGLLGGSFDPAHQGHRLLSLLALRYCNLDWIWWLVTPKNPLKKTVPFLSRTERIQQANTVANHPKILVTDLEYHFKSTFTVDTLKQLRLHFPHTHFIWILGTDNLVQLPLWKNWTRLFRHTRIVVIRRRSTTLQALASIPVHRYKPYRLPLRSSYGIMCYRPPVWVVLMNKFYPFSSRCVRETLPPMTKHKLLDHSLQSVHQDFDVVSVIRQTFDEHFADDVVTIDMTDRSVLFDTVIIASGRSTRHIWAITKKLLERLRQVKVKDVSVEGRPGSEWVLLDIGDVVVHIFLPKLRAFYDIDRFSRIEKDTSTIQGIEKESL